MTTDATGAAGGVGQATAVGDSRPLTDTVTETPVLSGVFSAQWSLATTASQTGLWTDTTAVARPITISQTLGLDPDAVYEIILGGLVEEVISLQETLSPNTTFSSTLVDTPTLVGALTHAYPKEALETIGVEPVVTTLLGLLVLEGLGMAGPPAAKMTYYPIFAETLALDPVMSRFLGGSLAEGVGVEPALTVLPRFARTAAETIGVEPAISPALIFRITATDSFDLDSTDIPGMILGASVAEGVELSAAHIAPSGNITTWAVNTRTGGVTEYQNYNFNSFAQLGHKYLGASADGLFELNGDTDDGTDIIGRIRSGYGQFNGSRFTGFKAAYLGLRAEGDMLFRLITGDGVTRTYAVKARDMETVKVNLGKGLRSRYFAFELESTGQDFDIESVEILPMPAGRRV